jgi:hypothetical protein
MVHSPEVMTLLSGFETAVAMMAAAVVVPPYVKLLEGL